MSQLLNAFVTTAGKTFKKVEDKRGTIRYFKDGTPVKPESWAGGNRNLRHIVTTDDGELPRDIAEADTAAELEDATGIPFTGDMFRRVEGADTKSDNLQAEQNRFLSFWSRNSHLDRDEAAKRYIEFRNELKGVEDAEARAIIKSRYNIGGS